MAVNEGTYSVEVARTLNAVLKDIRDRAGLSYVMVDSIDTRDRAVAEAVLPVLIEWMSRVTYQEDELPVRRGLYGRFHTPWAAPYVDAIIAWWRQETDQLALSSLTQTLALVLDCGHAQLVWAMCHELPRRPFHYALLARMANCPEVEQEVKDELAMEINTLKLRPSDLEYVAKGKDRRISRWLADQQASSDPLIRRIAKRVLQRELRLPKGVERASAPPDRKRERFSTEVEIDNIAKLFDSLSKDFRLKVPLPIRRSEFLSMATRDEWLVANGLVAGNSLVSLWFRREDETTVEVVLMPAESIAVQ